MIYVIENSFLKVQINSLGSELWSILDKCDNTEHLWQGDKEIWPRRAPNLFPVCGKLRNTTAVINGKEYKIPLHGFLRDYEHTVTEHSDTSIRFSFQSNEETHKMYPFDFNIDILFTLRDNELIQTFIVNNKSKEAMPFSIGYHTGYMCPFDDKHTINDYELVFEKKETAVNNINEDHIIVEQRQFLNNTDTMPLNEDTFNNINYQIKGLESDWVKLKEKDSQRSVTIGIKNFSSLVLWGTEKNTPYICIEPLHGSLDPLEEYGELKNKPDIEVIEPYASFSCYLSVKIDS